MSASELGEFSGYRGLWASVLLQAIKDLDILKEADAAKWWMYKSEDVGVGSYHWICNMLDIDEFRLALTCTTREGRWRILGPQYAGLHLFNDKKKEGTACLVKRSRPREIRRTARSHKK
jgi:hypothetical protein